jgi:hypothetical protein
VIRQYHLTANNRSHLITRIEQLDPTKEWSVNAIEWKSKRTLDQNSRLWKLYTALGDYIGLESDEVHQLMGYRFLRYQKELAGKVEEFIKSTTKLNTKEMADYQDSIERWAGDIGFRFEDMA